MKQFCFLLALTTLTIFFSNCTQNDQQELDAEVSLRPEVTEEDLTVADTNTFRAACLAADPCEHKTGFWGKEAIQYKITPSGQALLEDDIAFAEDLLSDTPQEVVDERSATATNVYLWPAAKVYYSFAPGFPTNLRNSFLAACQKWYQYTGVQFIQRTNQPNYIRVFKDGNSNYSYVGCKGGVQDLSLADSNIGVAIHELGHALGLIHEHQRSDRNSKVWVNPSIVNTGNFYRYTNSYHFTSFDWNSIMLYGSAPMENSWTMLKLPNYSVFINTIEYWRNQGSYALPSSGDINAVNIMY